jgi:hypothetical protein
MSINEIEAFIEQHMEKPVTVGYQTINLGNGSPEEQESGLLEGQFTGDSDNAGRTMRYHLIANDGQRYYLFADEITYAEVA